MKRAVSKSERIRRYVTHGIFTAQEISEITGVPLKRIYTIRWKMRHGGPDGCSYGAAKMRKYRAEKRANESAF